MKETPQTEYTHWTFSDSQTRAPHPPPAPCAGGGTWRTAQHWCMNKITSKHCYKLRRQITTEAITDPQCVCSGILTKLPSLGVILALIRKADMKPSLSEPQPSSDSNCEFSEALFNEQHRNTSHITGGLRLNYLIITKFKKITYSIFF